MSDEMWYLIEQQAKQITELSARINRSDEVDKQYAALRIEELERDLEECQKAKNVLLEALEGAKWLIGSYVFNPAHYEEYRDVVEAIEKARGVEGEDYYPGTAEQEANASMIAAAPEMLDLLMEAVARVEMGHDLTCTGWSDKAMEMCGKLSRKRGVSDDPQ